MFGSVFRFSHLKTVFFRFGCLARFAGILEFSLRFSVVINNDGVFSEFFFCPVYFTVFLVFPRKFPPAAALKLAQFRGTIYNCTITLEFHIILGVSLGDLCRGILAQKEQYTLSTFPLSVPANSPLYCRRLLLLLVILDFVKLRQCLSS